MAYHHHHHHRQQHFLVVALGAQGHINPARHLARRLAQTSPSIRVTIAVPIQTLCLMYPDTTLNPDSSIIDQEKPNSISFVPYSDGIEDDGLDPLAPPLPNFNRRHTDSLTRFALNAAPSAYMPLFITPGPVRAADEVPGLPRLEERDLPSLLTDENGSKSGVSSFMFALLQEEFRRLSQQISAGTKPKVLVNTFGDLESSVLASLDEIEMIAIGPLISTTSPTTPAADLFREDNSPVTAWQDPKEESAASGMPTAHWTH
ncbi:uncharacterized protein A4U43_C01F4540 [Asparagus officinalis]|uniref:Uncharacterized protein n=1 Tax=Asparagus officinalis TaxID=4686 RepID=A0A5P1FQI7_ASPOF|nr:uncharacterized protein A4U43_C01F4540 [Asparagus officinalis]